MQFVFGPTPGGLSGRYGRRPVLLVSLTVMAIDYVVMALAGSIWLLLAARVVGGLLAEFGTRAPFWAAAALAAANLAFGWFVLPEILKPDARRRFEWKRANPFGALRFASRLPGLIENCLTMSFHQQTNGKAVRFIQTCLREWAYGRTWQHKLPRTACLPASVTELLQQPQASLGHWSSPSSFPPRWGQPFATQHAEQVSADVLARRWDAHVTGICSALPYASNSTGSKCCCHVNSAVLKLTKPDMNASMQSWMSISSVESVCCSRGVKVA